MKAPGPTTPEKPPRQSPTLLKAPVALRGPGRRHRRRDVPRRADRHGRELTSAVRPCGDFMIIEIEPVSWPGDHPGGRGGGLVPDSCHIQGRTTATDEE